MNDDIKKLAADLVKSPHWRWIPGMRAIGQIPGLPEPSRVVADGEDVITTGGHGAPLGGGSPCSEWLARAIPDLDDPLTARGVEVVLDEAFGECSIAGPWASPDGVGWVVHVEGGNDVLGSGPTRLSAVVAALLTPSRLAVMRSRAARAARLAASTTTNKETP